MLYQELINQGMSNCEERHLNLNDCNTFLIWTYPQVGISVVIIAMAQRCVSRTYAYAAHSICLLQRKQLIMSRAIHGDGTRKRR